MTTKKLIYDLDYDSITAELKSWGEPNYRANQIWSGIYHHLWNRPNQFSNLPKALREKLRQHFYFHALEAEETLHSADGQTQKSLFRLRDGEVIEAVLMKYERRRTMCVSTQSGCAMGCVFCATGQMGFRRNLSSGEIVAQVLHFARQLNAAGERVTNVVLMGMGEPFHNYEATMEAIDQLNDPKGFNLGARRFTISAVGMIPMIQRFAQEKRQVNLAISLHAAEDELRASMLPINKKYPLDELIEACRNYVAQTSRRITFEWALIEGVNDTPVQAEKLVALLDGLLCHVNIIPLNPTTGYDGQKSPPDRVADFKDILDRHGISCTVRLRRGIEIQAGCGQLASKT